MTGFKELLIAKELEALVAARGEAEDAAMIEAVIEVAMLSPYHGHLYHGNLYHAHPYDGHPYHGSLYHWLYRGGCIRGGFNQEALIQVG